MITPEPVGFYPRDNPLVCVEVPLAMITKEKCGIRNSRTEMEPSTGKITQKVGPHGSGGSSKDGDGDTSFQWSQFTTPCSHLMFLTNDIMTTERPTTQLPQL
ncbi:hypothetical protein Tco_0394411 [Tanacetum coccineum]